MEIQTKDQTKKQLKKWIADIEAQLELDNNVDEIRLLCKTKREYEDKLYFLNK